MGKKEIFQSEVVVESLSPEGKVPECLLAAAQYNTWRGKANINKTVKKNLLIRRPQSGTELWQVGYLGLAAKTFQD